jgi:hypothetical protein
MCDKDIFEAVVICKKCGHGARLYKNPRARVRKLCKGAPAILFNSMNPSPEFSGWVSKVCQNQGCKNFNKTYPLSEDEFKSLTPPCCPVHKQKMKPEKDRQSYFYRCENNNCHSHKRLADMLPVWSE